MSSLKKQIQWFPGHMAKTIRQLTEKKKQIDLVIELVDARIPISSRNPVLSEIFPDHPRLLLLNKADLADKSVTQAWINHLSTDTQQVRAINSLDPFSVKSILSNAKVLVEKQAKKTPAMINLLVAGIPNVGKSTLINRLIGKRKTVVGNKPGVTKSNQWFNVSESFKLLDSPGILWPKFEDQEVGLNLAICQGIKESILDIDELAFFGLQKVKELYPNSLKERYTLTDIPEDDTEMFYKIAKKRGCLMKGGEYDENRTYRAFLMDLQTGKLGPLSFERP